MTRERMIRVIAGTFVLASLALGYWVDKRWFLFTAFVGLNLFQSGFSGWCLMDDILRKAGVKSSSQNVSNKSIQAHPNTH